MYVHCQEGTGTCDTACPMSQSIHHINIDLVYSTQKCLRKHMEAVENVSLSCLTCIPSLHLKNFPNFTSLHVLLTLLKHSIILIPSSLSKAMPVIPRLATIKYVSKHTRTLFHKFLQYAVSNWTPLVFYGRIPLICPWIAPTI